MNQPNNAFVVIDMQNGYLQRDVFNKSDLVDHINSLLDYFHSEGRPVFLFRHTNDSYSKINTEAWQLYEGLRIADKDLIINKSVSSAFKEKSFVALLESNHIQTITVAGLVSNGCVQAACIDGKKAGYSVTLISDAHSTFQKNAEQIIEDWNTKLKAEEIEVITTDEFIR